MAGPKITMNKEGKMKKIRGNNIFTGILAAFSSARCLRVSRIMEDSVRMAARGVTVEQITEALKAKGYPYQFIFAKEAGHVDRPVRAPFMGFLNPSCGSSKLA